MKACHLLIVQSCKWGNVMGDILGLRPLNINWPWSKNQLNMVADPVYPFMTTMYKSFNGCFQQNNALCQNGQVIPNWFLEHDEMTVLKWPLHKSDLNPANEPLGCGGMHLRCDNQLLLPGNSKNLDPPPPFCTSVITVYSFRKWTKAKMFTF